MKLLFVLLLNCFMSCHCGYFSDLLSYSTITSECTINGFFTRDKLQRFKELLNLKLISQPMITDRLIPALAAHLNSEPRKALVVSFHGSTGVGKNYVTELLIETFFYRKAHSTIVKKFVGPLHFPSNNPNDIEDYKRNLQKSIKDTVAACKNSLFIFDEVDKMPPGLIDAIKPFLDFHNAIDGVDYRHSMFIFISNIGQQEIIKKYTQLLSIGVTREEMPYVEFEPLLRRSLFDEDGAFQDSDTIKDHLVSLYLPFLPMEVAQVEQCILAELGRRGVPLLGNYVNSILDELEWDYSTQRFSTGGCKRVYEKVAHIIAATHLEL